MDIKKPTGRQIIDAIRAGCQATYNGLRYDRIAAYTYRAEYHGFEGGATDGVLHCRWQAELVQVGGRARTLCDPAKVVLHMPDSLEIEDVPKRTERFIPPEEDEVRAYCAERGNAVDAAAFVAFYAAKNWMIGKNKMKDWRAAVRTWENRDKKAGIERDAGGNKMSSFDTDEFFSAALAHQRGTE